MTTVKSQTKNILPVLAAGIMLFSFSSCAKKTTSTAKTETPAATEASAPIVINENKGQVQIKRDINSNYVIQINLSELEEFKNVEKASKSIYIVWMDADKQMAKNLGQINSNTAWLSDKSKATFEALSVEKPTKIYITSETSTTVKTPGKNIVWSTNKF